jgi:signal transduction histidine kinase
VTGGRVEISTAVVNGRATLSVINTGPITPWAEVDRLFQLFERLDPDRSHKRGHGLGLSIVAAIATGLKGPSLKERPMSTASDDVGVHSVAAVERLEFTKGHDE